MSAYHVLKFQISNPPSENELSALPFEIYDAWTTKVWCLPSNKFTPGQVAEYLGMLHHRPFGTGSHEKSEEVIKVLRALLKEAE